MKHESVYTCFWTYLHQCSTNGSISTTNLIQMMTMLGLNHLGPDISKESAKIVYHTFVKTNSIGEAIPRLCSKYPPDKCTNRASTSPKIINRTMCYTAPPFRICFSASTIQRSVALTSSDASTMFERNSTTKKRRARGHVETREKKQICIHNVSILKE